MSLSAAAIRVLAAKGLSAADIADVVEANEITKTRALSGAERTRNYRDRKAAERDACDECDVTAVTQDPPYERHSTLPESSSEANASSAAAEEAAAIRSVFDDWNAMAGANGLSRVEKLTEKRRRACRRIVRQDGLQAVALALERIPKSPFLLGRTGKWAGRGADFEFFIRPDTITKINEGRYDGKPTARTGNSSLHAALAAAYAEEELERASSDPPDYSRVVIALPAH